MYDVYASIDREFVFIETATAGYISDLTGIFLDDFFLSIDERGFVEFERSRDKCALVVPHGDEIPEGAFA